MILNAMVSLFVFLLSLIHPKAQLQFDMIEIIDHFLIIGKSRSTERQVLHEQEGSPRSGGDCAETLQINLTFYLPAEKIN